MPIVIDNTPAGPVVQNLAAVGAQQRRLQDADMISRTLRDQEFMREGQRRQQQIDLDRQRQQFHEDDVTGLRNLQTEQRQQMATSLKLPEAASLDLNDQISIAERRRQEQQDAQDVQTAQQLVDLAGKDGTIDISTMEGLARYGSLGTLAAKGPRQARAVMALLERERQRAQQMELAQTQGEYGLQREQVQQTNQNYREQIGNDAATERARMAAEAKVDPVAQRRAQAPAVFNAIMNQTNGRASKRVVDGLVEQWVATGKMEDRPTVSVSGETKAADPFTTPKYKALRAKLDTAAKTYQASLSEADKAKLDKASEALNKYIDRVSSDEPAAGAAAPTGDAIDQLIDSMSPEELKAFLAGGR